MHEENVAFVDLNRARLLARRGAPRRAGEVVADALDVFLIHGDLSGQASAHHRMALAQAQAGERAAARASFEAAIACAESVRAGAAGDDLRNAVLGRRAESYHGYTELLLDGWRSGGPSSQQLARAIEVDDMRRARGLIDDLGQGADAQPPAVLEAACAREFLIARAAAADQQGDLLRAARLRRRLEALEAAVPRRLAAGGLASLDQVRAELDARSVLLVFSLRADKASLFWVAADRIEAFELGDRSALEAQVRLAHRLLQRPGSAVVLEPQLRALADTLLGPIRDRLAGQRLLVVADGALRDLPIGALPRPGGQPPVPLVADHEIVYLPSASTLVLARRKLVGGPAAGSIAIVADPVFARTDPRFVERFGAMPGPPETETWPRLLASAHEARSIAARFAPDSARLDLGFDADSRLLRAGTLAAYAIIHLALHGELEPPAPALPRLVFSRYDQDGNADPQALLSVADIYHLDLPAQLVVLSACQSSQAHDTDSGLTSIAHAFFHAGARRLVGSLWQVGDAATAQLMDLFYQGMVERGMAPSAALTFAQRSMRDAGSPPADWAGFIFEGEWRPLG